MSEDDLRLAALIEEIGKVKPRLETPDFYKQVELKSKKARNLVDEENRGIIKMRNLWSTWVLIFIGVIIIFDIILIFFYGIGAWDFKDSRVVMVVITENFLKIVGLGVLITHNIFKKIF